MDDAGWEWALDDEQRRWEIEQYELWLDLFGDEALDEAYEKWLEEMDMKMRNYHWSGEINGN